MIKKMYFLKNWTWFYAALGLGLLLIVLIFGKNVNGAKINIDLCFFVFQPSEFVKIVFVFFVASRLYRKSATFKDHVITTAKMCIRDSAKGYICIEDNKPDCIEKLTELVKDEPRIEVTSLKTKYPQGAERCLIAAVSGREINSSMLPADAGCVVDNIDTVCAVYRAVDVYKRQFLIVPSTNSRR